MNLALQACVLLTAAALIGQSGWCFFISSLAPVTLLSANQSSQRILPSPTTSGCSPEQARLHSTRLLFLSKQPYQASLRKRFSAAPLLFFFFFFWAGMGPLHCISDAPVFPKYSVTVTNFTPPGPAGISCLLVGNKKLLTWRGWGLLTLYTY